MNAAEVCRNERKKDHSWHALYEQRAATVRAGDLVNAKAWRGDRSLSALPH